MRPRAGQRPGTRKARKDRPESWAEREPLPQLLFLFFRTLFQIRKMIDIRMSGHTAASNVLPLSSKILRPSFVWLLPFAQITRELYMLCFFMKEKYHVVRDNDQCPRRRNCFKQAIDSDMDSHSRRALDSFIGFNKLRFGVVSFLVFRRLLLPACCKTYQVRETLARRLAECSAAASEPARAAKIWEGIAQDGAFKRRKKESHVSRLRASGLTLHTKTCRLPGCLICHITEPHDRKLEKISMMKMLWALASELLSSNSMRNCVA